MAVMATQHVEGVALEQKTMPVPSSDVMALDLDINGNPNRNETNPLDVTPAPADDLALNRPLEMVPQGEPSPQLDVNGAIGANIQSFAANQAVAMCQPDLPVESRPTEISSSSNAQDSSPPKESSSNATSTDLSQVSVSAEDRPADSVLDAAIDTSIENTSAPTVVPPVVESQQSDVRDATPPTQEASKQVQPDRPDQGSATADSINGVLPTPAESPVNTSAADLTSASSDPALSQLTIKEEDPPQPTPTEQVPEINPTMDVDMLNTSALSNAPTSGQHDTEMADAAQPAFVKVAREREEDTEMEPSAKRAKTDDEADAQHPPTLSAPDVHQNGEPAAAKPDTNPITPHQTKEIIKVLKNVLRTNDGKNFRAPVSILWPKFAEAYSAKVSNPIDLGAIETKVKEGKYANWGDFRADVQFIAGNALLFNGENHPITKAGETVRDSIYNRTAGIAAEPVVVPKAPRKPAKKSTPQAESAPRVTARRPSRSAGSGPAAGATFALDPSTSTPLIRRDSTKNEGGRPKREIHPPKNKDLPYSVRPKARKFAAEMKFCEDTLNEMKKPKHHAFASAFYDPVDPVALNIPNYFTTIKNPMDLSTVAKKLQSGVYQRAKDFEADVRLIFANCYKFNPPGNPVREMGKQLEAVFENKWALKQMWVADNVPAAQSPSLSGSDEEESDEEEEVDQAAQSSSSAATVALSQRLIEEQTKLITLMQAKNPDQGLIQMQQDMVALVQSRVQENSRNAGPAKKASKKAKAPKGAKKPAAKKAAAGPSKKSSKSQKYMGTLEKETISAGLASLPDDVAESVLTMIKNDKPDVDAATDGTLELDIDQINPVTLWKIHALVQQYAPDVEGEIKKQLLEREAPRAPAKPTTKKKNKPMSKTEQERKIEQLRNSMQEFERHTSGSQEPVLPTVEQAESSGDEDSDDSEEE